MPFVPKTEQACFTDSATDHHLAERIQAEAFAVLLHVALDGLPGVSASREDLHQAVGGGEGGLSAIPSGQPGYGVRSAPAGNAIVKAEIGHYDTVAPNAPNIATLTVFTAPNRSPR
jgi:hypothetical protein